MLGSKEELDDVKGKNKNKNTVIKVAAFSPKTVSASQTCGPLLSVYLPKPQGSRHGSAHSGGEESRNPLLKGDLHLEERKVRKYS